MTTRHRVRTPTVTQRPGLRRIRRTLRLLIRLLVVLCHLLIWFPVLFVALAVLFTSLHPTTNNRNNQQTVGTTP